MTTPTAPASGGTAAPAVVTVGADAVWLPPGAPPVLVGGYAIAGGLCYVGAGLGAAYAATPEPALLDPGVPVRRVRLDQETPAEGVRPAYAELTPGARAAYLEWLAGGRVGPTLPVHLWLFLYGLERRVLVDLAGAPEWQEEYAAIAAELTTLRERYPAAVAFDEQAGELAALLETLAILGDPALQPPPVGPRTGELPMPLRVGLARYLAHGRPLPAAWAYCWYAYSDERRWGTAATRWPTEFRRTFETVYTHAHPGGMVVPAPPDELVLAYRPASPGFAGRTVRLHTTLPDVQRLADPLRELGELAARAEADLVAARGRVGPVPTTRRPPPPDRPAPAWPIPGSPEPDLSAPVPSAPMPSAPMPSA
ncbi:MAG TPA: TerB N-terminal domain-containing protein, partial [Pilimelia sp.]|nr:TerB N-terminal domain-containing protein [Pilimelia sp.]